MGLLLLGQAAVTSLLKPERAPSKPPAARIWWRVWVTPDACQLLDEWLYGPSFYSHIRVRAKTSQLAKRVGEVYFQTHSSNINISPDQF